MLASSPSFFAASVRLKGERISTRGMVLHQTRAMTLDEDNSRAVGMALKLLAVI